MYTRRTRLNYQGSRNSVKRAIKWILPIVILGIAVAVFMSLKGSKPQLPPKKITERSWSVGAVKVEPSAISPQIELYAEVENPRLVSLKASIAADVKDVLAKEGSAVKQGDLLVQLDTRDIDLQIAQQQAQIESLKAQLNAETLRFKTDQKALNIEREMVSIAERSRKRQQNLSGKNLTSVEQLDNAEMNLQQRQLSIVSREQSIADHPNRVAQLRASIAQSQAQLDQRLLDKERASVKAPFDGRVTQVSVAIGDRLRANDTLASIYPYTDLEVRAQLPASALPLIKRDQGATKLLKAVALIDGQSVGLTLDRLSAEVANGSTGVDGLFQFSSTQYLPEPGRTISLELELPEIDNVVALPPVSLYGTNTIYRIEDSRLQVVSVDHVGNRTTPEGQRYIIVSSPLLKKGDQIITTQLPNAVSGMLVEVIE